MLRATSPPEELCVAIKNTTSLQYKIKFYKLLITNIPDLFAFYQSIRLSLFRILISAIIISAIYTSTIIFI